MAISACCAVTHWPSLYTTYLGTYIRDTPLTPAARPGHPDDHPAQPHTPTTGDRTDFPYALAALLTSADPLMPFGNVDRSSPSSHSIYKRLYHSRLPSIQPFPLPSRQQKRPIQSLELFPTPRSLRQTWNIDKPPGLAGGERSSHPGAPSS